MPRQHPLFSPVALGGALLLLVLLLLALWQTGGRAFSPGALSAVAVHERESGGVPHHAAIGDDCTRCHRPFAGVAAAGCEQCHTQVQEQRQQQVGLHGRLQSTDCTACHREHLGTDHDLFAAALEQFTVEHHTLLFPLDGAHTDLECTTCHQDEQYLGTPRECTGCHAEPPLHQGVFGLACEQCHGTAAWHPARLVRHTFPLDHGGEGEIPCATCHEQTMTVYTCAACHTLQEMEAAHEDVDLQENGLDACAACHVTGTTAETEVLRRDS